MEALKRDITKKKAPVMDKKSDKNKTPFKTSVLRIFIGRSNVFNTFRRINPLKPQKQALRIRTLNSMGIRLRHAQKTRISPSIKTRRSMASTITVSSPTRYKAVLLLNTFLRPQ